MQRAKITFKKKGNKKIKGQFFKKKKIKQL